MAALSQGNIQATLNLEEVTLELPKFKLENLFQMKPMLEQLGIQKIFKEIDCTQTLGSSMFVDQIIQKTFIQVDEQGTEAAAVTAVVLKECCVAEPKEIRVNCNRPFWFILALEGAPIFVSSIIE